MADPGGRPDPHQSSGPLCRLCWDEHPSGYSEGTRSSSALRIALGLPSRLPAARQALVAELARRLGVRAWCDAKTDRPNREPFGHLDALHLGQARREFDQNTGGGRS